jgi:hypothetical protein
MIVAGGRGDKDVVVSQHGSLNNPPGWDSNGITQQMNL